MLLTRRLARRHGQLRGRMQKGLYAFLHWCDADQLASDVGPCNEIADDASSTLAVLEASNRPEVAELIVLVRERSAAKVARLTGASSRYACGAVRGRRTAGWKAWTARGRGGRRRLLVITGDAWR